MTVYRQLPIADTCAEAFGLQGPEAYAYTNAGDCLDVASINDSNDFQETLVCFETHFSDES